MTDDREFARLLNRVGDIEAVMTRQLLTDPRYVAEPNWMVSARRSNVEAERTVA